MEGAIKDVSDASTTYIILGANSLRYQHDGRPATAMLLYAQAGAMFNVSLGGAAMTNGAAVIVAVRLVLPQRLITMRPKTETGGDLNFETGSPPRRLAAPI